MWTLGADPELFMVKGDKVISAIGRLGGTKVEPVQAQGLRKGFMYQEDNVLVEYNIPPASKATEFVSHNKMMLSYLRDKVKKEQGLELKIMASAELEDDQLEDPRAHVFGCEPDFNVWTLRPNPRPHSDNPRLRSAGGHIHIGKPLSKVEKIKLGRALDLYVGCWSVVQDDDVRRRELYGCAGSIRFKPYGIEYRTPSNFWIRSNSLMDEMYCRVTTAIECMNLPEVADQGAMIQDAINTSNKDLACQLLRNVGW